LEVGDVERARGQRKQDGLLEAVHVLEADGADAAANACATHAQAVAEAITCRNVE
jgi:hypothetical protein